jgi:ABC transporter substrate binding protein
MRDAGEIEQSVETFARSPNGGLIVTAGGEAVRHRDLIVTLAVRHKLPAVYWERFFVSSGGLISYGADLVDQYRRAAGYVDRILKGEKPADLPGRRRQSTNSSSISRPPRRSASTCRRRCLPAPTR